MSCVYHEALPLSVLWLVPMDSSCLLLVRKARKQIHTSPRALYQWLRDGNWCRKFLTPAVLHGIILRHVFHRFPEFHNMMALRSSAGAAGGSPPPSTNNNTPRVHYLPFSILFFHCPTGFRTPHINYLHLDLCFKICFLVNKIKIYVIPDHEELVI